MKKIELDKIRSQLTKAKICMETEEFGPVKAYWEGYISELESVISKYEEVENEEE